MTKATKIGEVKFRPSQYFVRVTPDVLHYKNGAFEEGSVLDIRAIKRGDEENSVGKNEVIISVSADGDTPTTSVEGQMYFEVYSDTKVVTITLRDIDDTKTYDTKTVVVIKDGADGKPGAAGPSYYMAGSYSATVVYTRDQYKSPVVELDGLYYGKIKDGSHSGIDPKTDVANNGGYWAVFEDFKYIFTEAAFIKFGKLASAVFNGNYMFSQYGVTSAGAATDAYQSFDPSLADPTANAAFMPNILLDFYNGKAWFNDIVAKGTINADKGYIGNFFIEDGILAAYSSDNKKSLALTSSYIRFTDTMGVQSNDSVVTLGTLVSKSDALRSYLLTLESISACGVNISTDDYNIYSIGGDNILHPSIGHFTSIHGLKVFPQLIRSTSYYVNTVDDIIDVSTEYGNVTLYFRQADWTGKVLFIKRVHGSNNIILSGYNNSYFKVIPANNNSDDATTTFTISDNKARMFIYTLQGLAEFFCGY